MDTHTTTATKLLAIASYLDSRKRILSYSSNKLAGTLLVMVMGNNAAS